MIPAATRASASGFYSSMILSRSSFFQAAMSSSSRISRYHFSQSESVARVCWLLSGLTCSNAALIFLRASGAGKGGGPITLNCAWAAGAIANSTNDDTKARQTQTHHRGIRRASDLHHIRESSHTLDAAINYLCNENIRLR